jgi:nicotinate-nucleotide adenylyltransferase
MDIFCFGGSFNPIHHGHLICARAAAEALGFAQVTLIPSAQPPHKPSDASIAPPAHRLALCRLAVRGDPMFTVDDRELHRPGPSYTLDTVRALHQAGQKKIHWLIGADMLAILPQWHQADQLLQEVQFILMARPGHPFDWPALPAPFQSLRHHIVQVPQIDISATAIRRRVAQGQSISYLVPQPVGEYIFQPRLYDAQSDPRP